MRDIGPGDVENARQVGEWATSEFGQLAVEIRREIFTDLADLFFDDVVVVDQPFGGRTDWPVKFNRFGRLAIGAFKRIPVIIQSNQQLPRAYNTRGNLLCARE